MFARVKMFRLLGIMLASLLSVEVALADRHADAPSPDLRAQAAPGPPSPALTPADVPGRMLTIDEAVAIALATQPQIQARLSDYAAARFRVAQALSPLLPQISGGVSANKSQQTTTETTRTLFINNIRLPRAGSETTVTSIATSGFGDTFLAQVSLSQLLFDFGKTMAATDAARKLADVALEDVELQRQLIVLSVREAFTNILLAQRLTAVNRQAAQRAQLNLRAATRAFEVGLRAESDVARAEVDAANVEVDIIRSTNAERLALAALNTAMGLGVTTPTQVKDNLAYEPLTFDRPHLFAESIRSRPEHRQARLRVEALDALERQAYRNFFPDIVGSGSYGGTQFPNLNEAWTVGLSLSWTIFDGGNKIARHQEAKANVEGARARLQSSELEITRDVEQAIVSAEEAQARIRAAAVTVKAAERNYRFAEGRFRAGLATIIELTDAQFSLTQAQNVEAQALSDYRIALYRLDRALGRR
jgi:outer membrane protein TolC